MTARALARCAERVLIGVGDRREGQWVDDRVREGGAYHVRRRLHASEQDEVGAVVDIRRTPEALARATALGPLLRHAPRDVLAEEVGELV